MLTLRSGSYIFAIWSEPPLEVLAKIYVFNVTNPEEFLAGREKLRFQEIGPYVYEYGNYSKIELLNYINNHILTEKFLEIVMAFSTTMIR